MSSSTKKKIQVLSINLLLNLIEHDMALKDDAAVKNLKQKAIEFCEIPRVGLSSTLSAQKKAIEIRYVSSPSRLSFMACALLQNPSRLMKQSLLEIDDLEIRIKKVTELLKDEIDVIHLIIISLIVNQKEQQ